MIAVPTDDPENFDEGFLRPEKVDMSNDFLKECGNKDHFFLSPDVEGNWEINNVTLIRTRLGNQVVRFAVLCSGWATGNGKKLSNSQACCLAQLCLAAA